MATVDIECSECGAPLQVDESLLGSTMTCPACKMPTFVEPAGAYDLVEQPRTRPGQSQSQSRSQSQPPGSPPAPRPDAPETEEQRRLRERMERWAEDA